MHSTFYQELVAEQRDQSAMRENNEGRSEVAPLSLLTALPWFGGLIRTGDFIVE